VGINYAGNRQAAEETLALCRQAACSTGQEFHILQADISVKTQREDLIHSALAAFGQLDALVNNAGIAPKQRVDVLEMSEESLDEVMSVNLRGPLLLSQAVARQWVQEKTSAGKAILFVSSVSARMASTARAEYCISKAGIAMAVQVLAARLAPEGVLVCELRPGIIQTDMTAAVTEKYDALIKEGLVPQGRWGTPQDVGQAVAATLGKGFRFSTGSVIHIDGGLHIPVL
jgi:NAD(P)-dependent dehydrogenase (short-subunit alcohol dehydrogenase family)